MDMTGQRQRTRLMWLSDGENHLSIGSLIQKIGDAEKRPGRVGCAAHIHRELARSPSVLLLVIIR